MKKRVLAAFVSVAILAACGPREQNSDQRQAQEQEKILQEGTSAVGMPNIRNFRERRLMKDILELRDQDGLVTYTYQFSEMTGRLVFFCNSIGYPMSASTQFTNPMRAQWHTNGGWVTLPQADPNGLFSPSSAEGSWVMCVDSRTRRAVPVYSEPRLTASPFPLTADTPGGSAAPTAMPRPENPNPVPASPQSNQQR